MCSEFYTSPEPLLKGWTALPLSVGTYHIFPLNAYLSVELLTSINRIIGAKDPKGSAVQLRNLMKQQVRISRSLIAASMQFFALFKRYPSATLTRGWNMLTPSGIAQ